MGLTHYGPPTTFRPLIPTTSRAAERWGRDTFRAFTRGEITFDRGRELFDALTPEARIHLAMEVAVAHDELDAALRGERPWLPPCHYDRIRFLAGLFDDEEQLRAIEAFVLDVTPGADECSCRRCERLSRHIRERIS